MSSLFSYLAFSYESIFDLDIQLFILFIYKTRISPVKRGWVSEGVLDFFFYILYLENIAVSCCHQGRKRGGLMDRSIYSLCINRWNTKQGELLVNAGQDAYGSAGNPVFEAYP